MSTFMHAIKTIDEMQEIITKTTSERKDFLSIHTIIICEDEIYQIFYSNSLIDNKNSPDRGINLEAANSKLRIQINRLSKQEISANLLIIQCPNHAVELKKLRNWAKNENPVQWDKFVKQHNDIVNFRKWAENSYGWIRFAEQQPKSTDYYAEFLVLLPNPHYVIKSGAYHSTPKYIYDVATWDGKSFMSNDSSRKPLFWMPIPELPQLGE